eukprot:1163738-Amorphochlora_amoeboformis.AAC.1
MWQQGVRRNLCRKSELFANLKPTNDASTARRRSQDIFSRSRDFNHKLKSISAATFSPEEVEDLKAGGNGPAKKKWRPRWTERKFSMPDNDDHTRIREFLRMTYVEKKWMKRITSKKKVSRSRPTRSRPTRARPSRRREPETDEDEDVTQDVPVLQNTKPPYTTQEDEDEEDFEERKHSRRKKKSAMRAARRKPKPEFMESKASKTPPKSAGVNVTSLFGDLMIDEDQTTKSQPKPQPKSTLAAKPVRTQDEWANFDDNGGGDDWADFGKANSSGGGGWESPKPAPAQAPSVAPVRARIQVVPATRAPPTTRNLFGTALERTSSPIIPSFNIMEAGPSEVESSGTAAQAEAKKPEKNLHVGYDDPFGDILGGDDGRDNDSVVNTRSSFAGGIHSTTEPTPVPSTRAGTRSARAPNSGTQNSVGSGTIPSMSGPSAVPSMSETSPAVSGGNPFVGQPMAPQGFYNPQMNQQRMTQQMLYMQQQ